MVEKVTTIPAHQPTASRMPDISARLRASAWTSSTDRMSAISIETAASMTISQEVIGSYSPRRGRQDPQDSQRGWRGRCSYLALTQPDLQLLHFPLHGEQ